MLGLHLPNLQNIPVRAVVTRYSFEQLHFTDMKSCRLILNGVGIRASPVGAATSYAWFDSRFNGLYQLF